MITIPQILLGLFVLGLFAITFYVSFRSTKGPLSIRDLITHLLLLKRKFENDSPVNPEEERSIMEGLQNKAKTSCSEEVISGNEDLRRLFFVNCESVNKKMMSATSIDKTSWLRYGALMTDFNEQYFTRTTSKELQA